MSDSEQREFSGFGLYVLWTLVLILIYVCVGAIFSVPIVREQGIPLWLIISRLLVLAGLLGGLIGVLTGRLIGLWLFFCADVVMIPLSVTYTYYFLLLSEADFELTSAWIIRSTFSTALVVLVLVGIVFAIVRPRLGGT